MSEIPESYRQNVRQTLEEYGCISDGHFVGVSDRHLAGYCNIDPIIPHVNIVSGLIKTIVENFSGDQVQTIATPAVGAIPFAHWGAHHLMNINGNNVLGVWADKVPDTTKKFAFTRQNFDHAIEGRRVLIVEDMINQMTTVKAMIEAVRHIGGIVVGVGCIAVNEGVSASALDVPKLAKLCRVTYESWTAEACERNGLCAEGQPIVEDIGHGLAFKRNHPNYVGGFIRNLGSNI
ncbi:MAG: phosphoribosyltransferase family protein [Candidatus Saccharimonadales bacterium]